MQSIGNACFCVHVTLLSGYAKAHQLLGARLQPDYGSGVQLDDEDLQSAAYMFGQWKAAAHERVRKGLRLDVDPLTHCPVCSRTFRTELDDGEGGLARAGLHHIQ